MPRTKSDKPVVTAVVERDSRIERRLAGNPMSGISQEIPCKEKDHEGRPKYVFRIVNADVGDDHLSRVTGKGWDFAEAADVAGKPSDFGGFETKDHRLVRGTRSSQFLMKMRRVDYEAVLQAKDAHNRKLTFGSKHLKQEIVARASNELGDQGASFLHRNLSEVEITDTMERVPRDEQ